MKIVSALYKLARTANTVSSLSSPKKAVNRGKNIIIGKLLAKAGVWKKLWK